EHLLQLTARTPCRMHRRGPGGHSARAFVLPGGARYVDRRRWWEERSRSMAKSIEYPSADCPGPPRITVQIPDDWETLTVPGVQVAAAQPRVEGTFRANVVVTVQRFGPEFTLEAARAGLDQRKAALPELEELGTG